MNENLSNKCILIVDDEDDLTWSIAKTLEKNDRHFQVVCAADGNAALAVLAQRRVDVVVSDIRMPGRDGLQLLEDIRRDHPATKVIIMTAHGSHDLRREIEARGTAFYLEKPFEIRYLRQLIYEALDLAPPFRHGVSDASA
ncbi:MAG: response regulator [candidate division KSB1 bacterium]|nr:response regulator [candidate division KSB1 bacterium]MDZ7273361.1 response regulator [candidate division KSB1 bacterium]MDZ7288023.1 response regulator [candidate division KSB1 bacterium]MDZ7300125.1 response regulator [candidate division KSB1 bacterium]MDZ7309377.1 response regulator [candidate division KSB1 bacterium]